MGKVILAAIAALMLSACASTPTGNIEAFGEATKGVTEKVDTVISDYNRAMVNNELTKLAQRKKPISISKLDPVKKMLIKDSDKKRVALYRANKALGSYAAALTGLARAGSREEIDLAATQLYGSMQSVNEQYKTLTDKETDIVSDSSNALIARTIAEIGSLYAAKKRGDAIKEIVLAADEHVQKICDVIHDELMKGVIEERLYTMKYIELNGYIKDYNRLVAKSNFRKKRSALDDIYAKYLDMQSSSASVEQAKKAIRKIQSTHSTLKAELEKDNFSGKALAKAIGELRGVHQHYNDLEGLMLSCDREIVADDSKGIICKEG